MGEKIISAIDIGTAKIASIMAVSQEGEMRIVGFNTTPSRGVKKGLITDIDQVALAVEESVDKTERMAGHKMSEAYVAVGGPHIASLNSHGVVAVTSAAGDISEHDVLRVIEAARAVSLPTTRQILGAYPRDYSVDGQPGIKNPVGMSGVRLEVETHIVTAAVTNLKNLDRVLDGCNIRNAGFIPTAVSSAHTVVTETDKELGVVVVDIGAGKIDLCMYVDGALAYTAAIATGAKNISNDIAVGLRVDIATAEKVKLALGNWARMNKLSDRKALDSLTYSELGVDIESKDMAPKYILDNIIQPRIEEMCMQIAEEINKSTYGKQVPAGVVLTGGGSMTVGFTEIGKAITKLPMRVGIPTGVVGLIDEVLDPQYATTIGLLLCGAAENTESTPSFRGSGSFSGLPLGSITSRIKALIQSFMP